jgi:hypothetical protein
MWSRRSNLAPPPWRVFDALVGELTSWWVSVEDEEAPKVLASERTSSVTYSSPCRRRPDDIVRFSCGLDQDGYGCVLRTELDAAQPFTEREAATLRHRWGEHLDRDLRYWLDEGWPVSAYRVSAYRSDVADWAALDQLEEGQLWFVAEDVWVRVVPRQWASPSREVLLEPGAAVWALGLKRTAVRCLGQQPDDVSPETPPGERFVPPWYEGQELVIPFAEFGRRLRRAS